MQRQRRKYYKENHWQSITKPQPLAMLFSKSMSPYFYYFPMYHISLSQQTGALLIFHYPCEHSYCYINNNNTVSQGQINVF